MAALVAWLRAAGVAGVGQSSWGPTVFALTESQSTAEELARRLVEQCPQELAEVSIAACDNRGATLRRGE